MKHLLPLKKLAHQIQCCRSSQRHHESLHLKVRRFSLSLNTSNPRYQEIPAWNLWSSHTLSTRHGKQDWFCINFCGDRGIWWFNGNLKVRDVHQTWKPSGRKAGTRWKTVEENYDCPVYQRKSDHLPGYPGLKIISMEVGRADLCSERVISEIKETCVSASDILLYRVCIFDRLTGPSSSLIFRWALACNGSSCCWRCEEGRNTLISDVSWGGENEKRGSLGDLMMVSHGRESKHGTGIKIIFLRDVQPMTTCTNEGTDRYHWRYH